MKPAPEDELIPTRRSLLTRLKDWEDRDGWKEFFDAYWRLIYGVALKAGLTESEAEEVVQETVVTVAKQMPTFRYDAAGSFKAWLLQITRWRIVDQFRKRQPWEQSAGPASDSGSSRTGTAERIPAEEMDLQPTWDEAWERNLMDVALQRVRNRITPRHYQIFDLYVLKEWPVREVTRTLHVNAAQVYLTKHRVSGLVREELRRLEKQFAATEGKPLMNPDER
ncbi:MAG: sigma-70 family RNA polymerase sigma factor [Verrucomicrobiales bacterium]|nr:sigma-70 family RNA polymerase sigma factor [Verrucomicrobiales bacterium]